jgi:hypothetical protein
MRGAGVHGACFAGVLVGYSITQCPRRVSESAGSVVASTNNARNIIFVLAVAHIGAAGPQWLSPYFVLACRFDQREFRWARTRI